MSKVQFVTITENEEQQRVDNFLIARLKGVPKSHIYRILRKGEVRVNKRRVKAPYRLQLADVVRIPPVSLELKSEQVPINTNLAQVQQLEANILYESERVIVLNKPSGLAVHGGSGLSFGVIEALRQLRPHAPFLELVHRLDRDTSGCLLVAKKRSALRFLHQQLRDKTMKKVYLAIVAGRWPKQLSLVDAPLLKNNLQSGERVVKVDQRGKPAKTQFRIQQKFSMATLVECQPITGRTHQIRVHAQYSGCPILGDQKYADPQQEDRIRHQHKLSRLYLHAQCLEFREQMDEPPLSITAPVDRDFEKLLKSLSE